MTTGLLKICYGNFLGSTAENVFLLLKLNVFNKTKQKKNKTKNKMKHASPLYTT